MAQFARPSADTATGGWTTQAGSATNLYAVLDESAADDVDYARLGSPNGEILKIALSSVADPQSATGHIVRYRIGKAGTGTVSMTVALMNGATEIASWSHSDVDEAFTTYEQTLDAAEANAITDYSDLELWITADVVTAFTPTDIADLALWIAADAIVGLVDADPVTTWADSSGNGLDATGSGATRPTYKTAIVNGLPVVRYGADDILTTASTALGASGAITAFVVVNNIATGADRQLIEHGANVNTTEGAWAITRTNTNNVTQAAMRQQSAGLYASMESAVDAPTVTSIGLAASRARLVTVRFDRSLGQQEATLWVNGIYGGGHEFNTGGRANDTDLGGTFPGTLALNIGNRSGSATLGANGDIGEVLIYGRALTSRERARVAMYLHNKWDLVN